jgi:hypothetical protein
MLGLLISQLSEKPWKGRVITFNVNPEIHKIEGKTLQEKVSFMQRMQWDGLRSVLVRRAGAPRSSAVVVVNHCTWFEQGGAI